MLGGCGSFQQFSFSISKPEDVLHHFFLINCWGIVVCLGCVATVVLSPLYFVFVCLFVFSSFKKKKKRKKRKRG